MNLMHEISNYFLGEKVEALVFILPIGLLSLVFGVWLSVEGQSFYKGVAIPFVCMGLVMSIVGGVVGFRTPSQVKAIESGIQSEPEKTITNEVSRMEKVNSAWGKYLIVWAAFAVVGIGLRFFTKNDFAQGMGIALIFFAGVALLIDGFAERRAIKYSEVLESFQKQDK